MSDVYEAQLAGDQPPKRRRTSLAGWLIIGLFIGMLLIPLVYAWLPGEVARWHQAAAEEQRLDGDLDGALESLNRALQQFPDRANLLLTRAEWSRANGDYAQALADCERVLELAPQSPTAILLKSQILQHLGRFEEAVPGFLEVLKLSEQRWGMRRGDMLNAVAYARALANQDLDQALAEVEESLNTVGHRGARLDTRGFIHYLRGDLDKAREDLDQAVEIIEADYTQLEKQLDGERVGVLDPRQGRLRLREIGTSVAVIRYHRALVREALLDEAGAAADRERVRELGHEPTPMLF